MNAFTQKILGTSNETHLGSWIMSASPLIAEAMGWSGMDWAVIDMEHSPLDMQEVVSLMQAVAATPLLTVVRIPWNDAVMVKRLLDAGAQTLMFPFVQTAEEAAQAVAATRYPPYGKRGYAAMSRGSRFNTTPDYAQNAHLSQCIIVQLETPEAVKALPEIAAVEGVDALFMGPSDLSAILGHIGQVNHPEVQKLMADAAKAAHASGKPIGTVGGTPEQVHQYRAMGYNFMAMASDLAFFMNAAKAAVQAAGRASATASTTLSQGVY